MIIDDKRNLGSLVIPVGNNNNITVYSEFSVIPTGYTITQFEVLNNGNITLGNNTTNNNLIINAGIDMDFKCIIDGGTNYILSENDYAVEIVSDTYTSVTLPSANLIGGRTYIISRGSNTVISLTAQVGENIDSRTSILLKRKHDHIKVMANNEDSWYVI